MSKTQRDLAELLGNDENTKATNLSKKNGTEKTVAWGVMDKIDGIDVECIVGGVVIRVRFGGVNPKEIPALLREIDPGVEFRTSFGRGGGKRDTKTATVLVVNLRSSDSGMFIDFVCRDGDEDLSVATPKKMTGSIVAEIDACEALSAEHIEKLKTAAANKGSATVVLREAEQFEVRYWRTDDGRAFLEGVERSKTAGGSDGSDGSGGSKKEGE